MSVMDIGASGLPQEISGGEILDAMIFQLMAHPLLHL